MSRSDLQLNFRIPAKLKAELEQEANKEGRSLTTHLVHILEERKTVALFEQLEQFLLNQQKVNVAIAESLGLDLENDLFLKPTLNSLIRDVLPARAANTLIYEDVIIVKDLVNYDLSRLHRLPNVGKNTYAIIEKFLLDNGFIKEPIIKEK